jgi:hypothetical protein
MEQHLPTPLPRENRIRLPDHSSGGGPRPCLARQLMIVRISAGSRMAAITAILLPQLGVCGSYCYTSQRVAVKGLEESWLAIVTSFG